MTKKKCSIRGFEYDGGSFSDIIHQYIEASTKQDLERVKEELKTPRRLQELQYWTNGVLSEFVPHFKERFEGTGIEEIRENSEKWALEIDKWNWMGLILGQLNVFKWSEEIYRALYNLICELQASKGRIHKGTPLHQIGWVNLLRGNPESIKKSQYYMKLAMLEDKISNEAGFKDYPAYQVLQGEHNLSGASLDRLAEWVNTYKTKYPETDCSRPELIYLEYVIDRSNQERSSLYDLDTGLARYLMEKVKKVGNTNEKGKSLEILVSYLFLTTPGFEVLRNLVSFDGQIDLLVRNLHINDPILDELGKYIIVECKNLKDKVKAETIRDFAIKVIQASCNSGIIFSQAGYTGDVEREAARDARMAIIKAHQRHKIIIVPLNMEQLKLVIEKQVTFLDTLISEYEKIRFDLA